MELATNLFGRVAKIWGRNGTVGTGWEELYQYDQALDWSTIFDAAYALDFTSSSVADDDGSTGATKVTIYGLDGSYNKQSEEVTMNGQTIVTTTKTFLRVFGAAVTAHGTGKTNAGNIHIVKTGTGGSYTDGEPGTLTSAACKILAGWDSSMNCMFTVPAGERRKVVKIIAGAYTQAAVFGLFIRSPAGTDKSTRLDHVINLGNQGAVCCDLRDIELEYPEKTDIMLRVLGASASAVASGTLVLEYVPEIE